MTGILQITYCKILRANEREFSRLYSLLNLLCLKMFPRAQISTPIYCTSCQDRTCPSQQFMKRLLERGPPTHKPRAYTCQVFSVWQWHLIVL